MLLYYNIILNIKSNIPYVNTNLNFGAWIDV